VGEKKDKIKKMNRKKKQKQMKKRVCGVGKATVLSPRLLEY